MHDIHESSSSSNDWFEGCLEFKHAWSEDCFLSSNIVADGACSTTVGIGRNASLSSIVLLPDIVTSPLLVETSVAVKCSAIKSFSRSSIGLVIFLSSLPGTKKSRCI